MDIFHRNLQRAEIFLARHWKPCPLLDRRIIVHDHDSSSFDGAYSCDHAGSRTSAMILIHFISRKSTYLIKSRPFIDQIVNSLAGGQFVFLMLFFDPYSSASFMELISSLAHLPELASLVVPVLFFLDIDHLY